MVYYSEGLITIRNMEDEDAQVITDAEIEQGWHVSVEKYHMRLEDQRLGKAISWLRNIPENQLDISIFIPTIHGAHSPERATRRSLILAFWKNIGIRVSVPF